MITANAKINSDTLFRILYEAGCIFRSNSVIEPNLARGKWGGSCGGKLDCLAGCQGCGGGVWEFGALGFWKGARLWKGARHLSAAYNIRVRVYGWISPFHLFGNCDSFREILLNVLFLYFFRVPLAGGVPFVKAVISSGFGMRVNGLWIYKFACAAAMKAKSPMTKSAVFM